MLRTTTQPASFIGGRFATIIQGNGLQVRWDWTQIVEMNQALMSPGFPLPIKGKGDGQGGITLGMLEGLRSRVTPGEDDELAVLTVLATAPPRWGWRRRL